MPKQAVFTADAILLGEKTLPHSEPGWYHRGTTIVERTYDFDAVDFPSLKLILNFAKIFPYLKTKQKKVNLLQ